jgi:hypothetical protein
MNFLMSLLFLVNIVHAQTSTTTDSSCVVMGVTPLTGTSCCQGLKFNAQTGLCEDAIVDTALVACKLDSDCSNGKGCYPQREEDIYSSTPTSEAQLSSQIAAQDSVEEAQEKLEDTEKELGESCTASSQCESFSCLKNKCVDKLVCRLADQEEKAVGNVQCDAGLVKTVMGVCDTPENEKKSIYVGLLDTVQIKGSQCQFTLDEDASQKSLVAIKTLRAMEWHFSTSSLSESQECLKALPFLRDDIGGALYAGRKKILNEFNKIIAAVEADYQTLRAASDKSDATVNYNGATILEKDLATRRASGYDGMTIMWRRNLAFQSYETSMNSLIKTIAAKIAVMSKDMEGWNYKSKRWTLNGKEYTYKDLKCRGGKKKKIKKRWDHYVQVKGSDAGNTEILSRQGIADYLSLMTGSSSSESTNDFRNGPPGTLLKSYYLLDLLMPGRELTARSGKTSLGSYKEIWQKFNGNMKDYFKSMKGEGAPADFIYEPELIPIESRACFADSSAQECANVSKFYDEMTDIGFAQFIAYGVSPRRDYKKFFTNTQTWRRKLFNKLETDTQNITKFYEAMATKRNEQSTCLESAINQVAKELLNDPESGVATDLAKTSADTTDSTAAVITTSASGSLSSGTGASNATGTSSGVGGGTGATGIGSGVSTLTPASRISYQVDLSSGTFSSLGKSSNLDSLGKSTIGSSAGVAQASGASAAISSRFTVLKNANQASSAIVSTKDAATQTALANLGKTSSGVSGTGSKSPSGSMSGSGLGAGALSGHSGNLLTDLNPHTKVASIKEIAVSQRSIGIGTGAETSGAAAGVGGITEGVSSSSTSFNSSTSGSNKPALSEEDEQTVMANYERTKGDYKSSEEDELFSKVSKAYVRNLDKVLTKKKLD